MRHEPHERRSRDMGRYRPRRFRRETGCDHEDCLVDLLCDLMHWAAREEIDFDGALDTSRFHYRAELAEEGGIK